MPQIKMQALDNASPLTMSVREFSAISGLSEYTIRQEVVLGRIPHRRVGRRGLVRILRIPAIAGLRASDGAEDVERAAAVSPN